MSTIGQGGTDAAVLLASLAGKHVCPFCGTVRRQRSEPCPRCTMEDSTETRQATRNRIGPWYVLQSRNPSAPGMKFDTLLLLIRRGQVTPRSIVRGPTTHQLWRFAVRIRGLSREWGMCYSCGREIEATETACRHCHKPQEPPLDPDALLEVRQPAPAPQPAPSPVTAPLPAQLPTSTQIVLPELGGMTSAPIHARPEPSPPAPVPAAATTIAAVAPTPQPTPPTAAPPAPPPAPKPAPAPAKAPAPRNTRDVEQMLSPKDLAAAFSLDFNAASQTPDYPPRRRGRLVTRVIALVVLVGVIAAVAILALNPRLRRQTLEPASRYVDRVMDRWRSAAPGEHPPAVSTPVEQPKPAAPSVTAQPPKAAVATPTPPSPPAIKPLPGHAPLSLKNLPMPPAVHTGDVPSQVSDTPPAAADAPDVPATPKPTVATAPKPAVPPPAPNGDQAEQVRSLWIQAINAEGGGNLSEAVRIYEKIQTYPRDLWPTSLQLRLEQVKKQMAN